MVGTKTYNKLAIIDVHFSLPIKDGGKIIVEDTMQSYVKKNFIIPLNILLI